MEWWSPIFTKIMCHENLTFEEARDAAYRIFISLKDEDPEVLLLLSGYFGGLTMKGLTLNELAGMAAAMEMTKTFKFEFDVKKPIVTGGGTGGDTFSTINVTTPAILVAASAGSVAIKSGAKAFSSKTGATDLALTMGINVYAPPLVVKKCVEEVGTTVWASQTIYPWMESLLKVRDHPTAPLIFPLLNSLRIMIATALNPFSVGRQVRGVSTPNTRLVAEVLSRVGHDKALVPLGYGPTEDIRIDEFSNIGRSVVSELKPSGRIETYEVFPEDLGIRRGHPDEIRAADTHIENAKSVLKVLSGKDRGPRRDLILMNAGSVLYLADQAGNLKDGYEIACNAVDSGKTLKTVEKLVAASQGDTKRFQALVSSL